VLPAQRESGAWIWRAYPAPLSSTPQLKKASPFFTRPILRESDEKRRGSKGL
jgi:hypothetical protein